jgi:hypothetical protein
MQWLKVQYIMHLMYVQSARMPAATPMNDKRQELAEASIGCYKDWCV